MVHPIFSFGFGDISAVVRVGGEIVTTSCVSGADGCSSQSLCTMQRVGRSALEGYIVGAQVAMPQRAINAIFE